MKRTNVLTYSLAALAVVVSTFIPADAAFLGMLQRTQPWTLQLANATNGPAAITVFFLGRRLEFETPPLVPAAGTRTFDMGAIPKDVTRIIIEVDFSNVGSSGGQGIIDIEQGANSFSALLDATQFGTGFGFRVGIRSGTLILFRVVGRTARSHIRETTVKPLGLTIPQSVLLRADEVIQ